MDISFWLSGSWVAVWLIVGERSRWYKRSWRPGYPDWVGMVRFGRRGVRVQFWRASREGA